MTVEIIIDHKDKLVELLTVTSSSSLLLVGEKSQEKEEEDISSDTYEAKIKGSLVEHKILSEYMMP